jgi:hypothetical protein
MKKIINLLLLAIIMLAFSCKKQETIAYYTGSTAPSLTGTANSGGTVLNLKAADSTLTALSLIWTNPNYMFNTGVNSLNVNYLIEIDTLGSNFSNPKRAQISLSDTSAALTEALINNYLSNQMSLDTSVSHKLQVRVMASITTSGNGVDSVYSNVLSYTAKPYFPPPVITPPASGTLFIVGSAVPVSGWNNPITGASQIALQQFTKVSFTLYTLTIALIGGGEYKFVAINDGGWNPQYSADDPTAIYGGKFVVNGNNALAPPVSGTYKITVSFQTGTFTVVKQ